MELPIDFVDLLDEYFKSQSKDKQFRLATIDPTYNGTGFPKVQFDGDDDVAEKGYSFLNSYNPVAGDKVLLQLIGNAYVIIGKINNPQNSTGGYTPPSGGGGSTSWDSITGKPLTFNPTPHSHSWVEITDKPTTFTPATHTHDWTELTGVPSTFTPSTHSHLWTEITGKPTTFMPSAHTHLWADITDKPTTFTPSTHTHVIANITNFPSQTGNTGKVLSTDGTNLSWITPSSGGGAVAWADITGKPTTFTPSAHTHVTADVTGLDTALAGKAATSHTHADATTSVAGFMTAAMVTKLNGIATSANNYVHPTGDGNLHVPVTSTTNNGKFLKAGATAGAISWQSLVVSDVTGLQTALDAKVDESRTSVTIVSGDYLNGWSEFTGRPVKITKGMGGEMVHITGAIRLGTTNLEVFNIPTGYRPSVRLEFSCPTAGTNGGNARVSVETDGRLRVIGATGGDVTFVALDGIMYLLG